VIESDVIKVADEPIAKWKIQSSDF
jgi:hypothetical protein